MQLNPYMDAIELRDLVLGGQIRPREVAEFFVARAQKLNSKLGAFMTLTPERAFADAERLEKLGDAERRKCLMFGVPYSIKDLNWTSDVRTTMGSRNYENFRPAADDEIVVRMRNAGGILIGKTSTPEFGARPTTEGGLCPPARNPWNLEHTTGGSSGGAAGAVAAGLGPIAQGSDGGGSIRIPSACCGIVGLKPARGRITLAPVAGEAWAGFATYGPMARSVRDIGMFMDVLSGAVLGDPYWAPDPVASFRSAVKIAPRNLKIAMLPKSAITRGDAESEAACEQGAKVLEDLGHRVEPVKIDPGAMLRDVCMKLIVAGISTIAVKNPELMDPVVRFAWEQGRKLSACDYILTVASMHNISREIVQALGAYDAIISPTLARPAVKIGTLPSRPDNYLEELPEWIPYTFPFNATGQPAFSLPNGFNKAGLPIGFQIVGRPADEVTIIGLAQQFEEARPWKDKHPPLD